MLEKNDFGKPDFGKKTILEKPILEKNDFGKKRFWKKRFWKKTILELPVLEKQILEKTFLEKPFWLALFSQSFQRASRFGCLHTHHVVLTHSNLGALAVHNDPYCLYSPKQKKNQLNAQHREAEATTCNGKQCEYNIQRLKPHGAINNTKTDTSKTFCHNFGSTSWLLFFSPAFGLASFLFARFFLCQLLFWQIMFSQVFALPTFGLCQEAPQPITELAKFCSVTAAARIWASESSP